MERERRLAYNIAALSGAAFAGKLKSLDEHFPSSDAQMTNGSAALLGRLFKMKRRGVPMEIERVERLH